MKLTIEQLQELGFIAPYTNSDRIWIKSVGNRDAFFFYDFQNYNIKDSSHSIVFELRSSDGGDTSSIYGPITSLEKFHELEKVLNS